MKGCCILLGCLLASTAWAQLPSNYQLKSDWLLDAGEFQAVVESDADSRTVTFGNGLFQRKIDFRLGATIDYTNLMTGESIIRAVEPEGSVTINGIDYRIGGAEGQMNKAFLTAEWVAGLKPAKGALELVDFEVSEPRERLKWKQTRHHAPGAVWPPKGKLLRLDYRFPKPSVEDRLAGKLMESKLGRPTLFLETFEKLDPQGKEKAFLSVYNPTDQEISKEIWVPLYYSGLSGRAQMSVNGQAATEVSLDASGRMLVTVTAPAQGYGYTIFQSTNTQD